MTSSVGESGHTDGVDSDQPMIALSTRTRKSDSYSQRLTMFARRGRFKWASFVGIAVLVLLLLVCGAVALILTSSEQRVTSRPDAASKQASLTGPLPKEEKKFKFEYQTGERRKEQVVINVKQNYTELFAEDVTVFNHFRRRISLHRIEISPGKEICLVKTLDREVKPKELETALTRMSSVEVNSTKLYVVDSTPVPEDVGADMTVHKFCQRLPIYPLKPVNESGPEIGMTMEQLIERFSERDGEYPQRLRREATSNPLDKHNGGPYHCGGPIGADEPIPAREYTCTKKKSYCYRSLVNEQCDECYHGHYLRSRDCWCPIKAIQTCIKITYRPRRRSCCGVDVFPCIYDECNTQRVPYIPVPVITFKIVTD